MIALVAVVFPAAVHAQPTGDTEQPTGDTELADVETELADVETELTELARTVSQLTVDLSASDCGAACEAVASMSRAANRVCELAPGPRCAAARDRVARARKRVSEACPDCDVARENETAGSARKKYDRDDSAEAAPADGVDTVVRGENAGCATCTVGRSGSSSHALIAALAGLFLLAGRRRRNV